MSESEARGAPCVCGSGKPANSMAGGEWRCLDCYARVVEAEHRKRMERVASPWSTTPPTQPGWYWARYKTTGEVEMVAVDGLSVRAVRTLRHEASRPGVDVFKFMIALSDFDLWAGPITAPLPEGK